MRQWSRRFSSACTAAHETRGCDGVALGCPAGSSAGRYPSAAELVAGTLAVTPDAEHGKILFLKHCARCHGAHAWGDGPREIPTLAGQRERYVIEQVARFATDERAGSKMHGPAMYETL